MGRGKQVACMAIWCVDARLQVGLGRALVPNAKQQNPATHSGACTLGIAAGVMDNSWQWPTAGYPMLIFTAYLGRTQRALVNPGCLRFWIFCFCFPYDSEPRFAELRRRRTLAQGRLVPDLPIPQGGESLVEGRLASGALDFSQGPKQRRASPEHS